MKKLIPLLIVIVAMLAMFTMSVPAMAQEPVKINKAFSVEPSSTGHQIPKGSIISQREDGTTEVRDVNNRLILTAKDSEVEMIPTPGGLRPATHVLEVPNNALVVIEGNTTKVFEGEQCILTAIDRPAKNDKLKIPDWDDWIESSNDWTVDAIDYFSANWICPSDPPDPGSTVVDFLFNAIETNDGNIIIQPVLEWNYGGSGRWTGAPWVVRDSPSYCTRGTPKNVTAGDSLIGTMKWTTKWKTSLTNSTTGLTTSLSVDTIPNRDTNMAVFCALEGYDVTKNDDVPGDTTFSSMSFKHNGSAVSITWAKSVAAVPGLSGYGVTIYSSSKVKLYTAN